MNKVKLITDNCCSLSVKQLEELDIDYVQMCFTVNGKTREGFDPSVTDFEAFYEELEKSSDCSTSSANYNDFLQTFEKYVKQGMDVVYVGLSGGLSCTCDNARLAAKEINAQYGEHAYVADSLTGSYTIALMLEKACEMVKNGCSAKEIFQYLDKNGAGTVAIFIPGDLKFLRKSGRIGRFAASIGSLLKIVPLLTSNEKGELKLISKSIGHKKAMAVLQEYILKNFDTHSPGKIYVGHTGQKEHANAVADFLRKNTTNKEIVVDYIDCTMGCNCGPKTIAVFGFKK